MTKARPLSNARLALRLRRIAAWLEHEHAGRAFPSAQEIAAMRTRATICKQAAERLRERPETQA